MQSTSASACCLDRPCRSRAVGHVGPTYAAGIHHQPRREEATPMNHRCGVPAGARGKKARDGLTRGVRNGCPPWRGACPGRGQAAYEARSSTSCLLVQHTPSCDYIKKKESII